MQQTLLWQEETDTLSFGKSSEVATCHLLPRPVCVFVWGEGVEISENKWKRQKEKVEETENSGTHHSYRCFGIPLFGVRRGLSLRRPWWRTAEWWGGKPGHGRSCGPALLKPPLGLPFPSLLFTSSPTATVSPLTTNVATSFTVIYLGTCIPTPMHSVN